MPKKLVFLKSEQDFSNFKKSKSLMSENLRIRWYYPKNQNITRFGFIIPKKLVKKVTDRNLIKRRLKSILSKHLDQIQAVDILFFPKPGSIKLKFSELEAETANILQKARIYANNSANK